MPTGRSAEYGPVGVAGAGRRSKGRRRINAWSAYPHAGLPLAIVRSVTAMPAWYHPNRRKAAHVASAGPTSPAYPGAIVRRKPSAGSRPEADVKLPGPPPVEMDG